MKVFTDDKINVHQKLKFDLGWVRKHCGKRRKCWLPAFSPFPTMFSKAFPFGVVKSRGLCGKGLDNKVWTFSSRKSHNSFRYGKMGEILSHDKDIEGKAENACYEQFLLLSQHYHEYLWFILWIC